MFKIKKMSKNVKCCMIGKQKVGKTRFFDTYFGKKIKTYTPTVGVDFLKINNMVIWDTSGENRFVTVTRNFVLSSTVLFCLYSDFDSYTWINNYMKSLDFKITPIKKIFFINVGTIDGYFDVDSIEHHYFKCDFTKKSVDECIRFIQDKITVKQETVKNRAYCGWF